MDVKPYIIHDFTVAGDWLYEAFGPITDYNKAALNLTGLAAEISITAPLGGVVATLTSAAGEITLTATEMKWAKDLSALAVGYYNYVFKVADSEGRMIPRMIGTMYKKDI